MKYLDILPKTVFANKVTQEILKNEIPVRGDITIEIKLSKGDIKDIKLIIKE